MRSNEHTAPFLRLDGVEVVGVGHRKGPDKGLVSSNNIIIIALPAPALPPAPLPGPCFSSLSLFLASRRGRTYLLVSTYVDAFLPNGPFVV